MEDKNFTISGLYGLRAGMSLISESSDEVREISGVFFELQEMKRNCEKSEQELDRAIVHSKAMLDIKNKELSDKDGELAELGTEQDYINNNLNENKYKVSFLIDIWSWWYVLSYFIIGLLISPSLGMCASYTTGALRVLMILLIFLVPAVLNAIVMCISALINKLDKKKRRKKDINGLKEEYGAKVRWSEKDKAKIEGEIEKLEADYKEQLQTRKEASDQKTKIVAAVNDKLPESNKKIKQLKSFALCVETMLKNEYSAMINPADWANVDLLIFYLSSGRADTLKEALQQVDNQRRTEAIVKEIRYANENVCREIHGGFAALGTAIIQCFNVLGEKINAAFGGISSDLKALSVSMSAQNELFAKGVSSLELNNALQKKANVTSEKLLQDLNYIREKCELI